MNLYLKSCHPFAGISEAAAAAAIHVHWPFSLRRWGSISSVLGEFEFLFCVLYSGAGGHHKSCCGALWPKSVLRMWGMPNSVIQQV